VTFNIQKDIISKNGSALLGNEDFELANLVSIYPNPTSSIVNISLPNTIAFSSCEVYNALGQKMGEYFSPEFALTQLAAGMYSLVIKTSEGAIHKNIIKK